MNKAYKFRIYPTKKQQELMNKTFGCVRFIWNKNVEVFNSYDKETNPKPNFKTTTEYRKEFDWLKEVSSGAVQQKENDFKEFKTQFFSKSRKVKICRCKFKKKFDKQSYRLPNQKFILDQEKSKLRLEKIPGFVKIVLDRKISEDVKFLLVTISKNSSQQYFATIVVEEDIKPKYEFTKKEVGIDLGITNYITMSTGEKVENPRWFSDNQAKLAYFQRILSKKKVGSRRFYKLKLKVAKIHQKTVNQRDWWIHQVTNKLVKDFDFIATETLDIDNLLQKIDTNMAKNIQDASWSKFIIVLNYKAKWNNKVIQQVDQYFPSSKLCSSCGFKNDELTLQDRFWICPNCNTNHDRDYNASVNILNEAKSKYQSK
jgi:putative transposase